ncbi:hypothetical protein BAC3_00314 [uncultured bacterium]|nr:hypothetical protein BAC3_00314 [uncultured bacterium]
MLKEKAIHELQEKWAGDEGKILECLEPRIKVDEMKGIEREVWDSIFKHIRDYPFIKVAQSSKKVSPQQIYIPPESVKHFLRELFPQEHSIDNRYIPESSFISTNPRIKALLALGAEELTPQKFINCLDTVRRGEVEWCTNAISVVIKLMRNEQLSYSDRENLAKLCCNKKIFLCSDGILRNADINYPIFLPSEGAADLPKPPDFIKVAFLETKVIEHLNKEGKEGFEELFLKQNRQENVAVYKFNKDSILKNVILPWLKNNNNPITEQACELRKFLFHLMKIDKTDWNEPWNKEEDIRTELCKLRVPIREDGEAPAWQVYAGREWTGDESLEKLYGGTKERYFLQSPEKEWDKKTRKIGRHFTDGWERIFQDRELSKVAIKLLTKEIVENNNKAIIKYSSNRQEDKRNQNWQPLSFFSYSLKNMPWLPALDEKVKIQQSALDLFMPGSQIDREFSEIFPRLDIEDEPLEQTKAF